MLQFETFSPPPYIAIPPPGPPALLSLNAELEVDVSASKAGNLLQRPRMAS